MSKQVVCRYNLSAAKEYTTAQNERKTQWVQMGTAVQFDDGLIVANVNTVPTGAWWDGTVQLFKQEPRQQQGYQQGGYQQPAPAYQQPAYGQQQYGQQQQAPAAQPYPAQNSDTPF